MNNDEWAIIADPQEDEPQVGGVYKITRRRNTTVFGRVQAVDGQKATVEILRDKAWWEQHQNDPARPAPETLDIQAGSVFMVKAPPCFEYIGDTAKDGSNA